MKQIFYLVTLVCLISIEAIGQSWNITGNAGTVAGTNFIGTTDGKDLVFKTNGIERGRIINNNGTWRFGSGSNNIKIDSTGSLTFSGSAVYKVAGNKYAFQYAGNPNYGLFFNTSLSQYEFRNGAASPMFSVGANTGNGVFTGTLKVGNYTMPSTDGTNGQVLKTNGAGVLSWSSDNGTAYTAGSGITISGTTIYNKLSTGVAGGQSIYGGTATGNNLTLYSTTNATKGKILFGTSAYDEVNNRLGIGTTAPGSPIHVVNGAAANLSGTGFLQLGYTTGNNIAIDAGVVQARYNGSAATLYLNYYGGDTRIGGSTNELFEVADGGNIGIGAYAGNPKVNIQGRTDNNYDVLYVQSNYNTSILDVIGIHAVSEIADGYGIGVHSTGGYRGVVGVGNGGSYIGSVYGVYGSATGSGNVGSRYGVYGVASGGSSNWAGYFSGNAYATKMSIGTSEMATGYTLSVNGKIICTEARVEAYANWPDYVFQSGYELMPLNELEESIQTNNHLPGIPAASEIQCSGFDIGDMQAKLLQKVEELTLYLIELNKQNEILKQKVEQLECK